MNNTHKIGLVSKSYEPNEIGAMIETDTIEYVWAENRSISGKEFSEGAEGLKRDCKFVVRSFEYKEQSEIVFDGIRYSIYRPYRRDDGFTELYVEKKVGDLD